MHRRNSLEHLHYYWLVIYLHWIRIACLISSDLVICCSVRIPKVVLSLRSTNENYSWEYFDGNYYTGNEKILKWLLICYYTLKFIFSLISHYCFRHSVIRIARIVIYSLIWFPNAKIKFSQLLCSSSSFYARLCRAQSICCQLVSAYNYFHC